MDPSLGSEEKQHQFILRKYEKTWFEWTKSDGLGMGVPEGRKSQVRDWVSKVTALNHKASVLFRTFKLMCLVTQSCLTLCNPMDCSPLGSSVCGSLQARILKWVVLCFSRGSSWPIDQTHFLRCRQIFFLTEPPGKPILRTSPTKGRIASLIGVFLFSEYCFEKKGLRDFPSGSMVKNPPCNARNSGLIPGWGTRIPHA